LSFKHTDITELIIKTFYTVYNTLGYGFLEKVYRNALAIEPRKLGLDVIQEARITVYYDGEVVGEYFADLLVAGAVSALSAFICVLDLNFGFDVWNQR
jgi:GxxExxY protein